MNKKSIFVVIFMAGLYMHCSVKVPELNVTGEKTALENQVLGTYQQIESDSWVIASTRSVEGNQDVTMSAEKQKVLDAVENRKFNKDDIDEFKDKGVIGEDNRGFLQVLSAAREQDDEKSVQLVQQIVDEENRDRQVIYERVLLVNPAAASADSTKIVEIFSKLNQDNSKPGTHIQLPDGTWTIKK